MPYPLYTVDAFTNTIYGGNQAAVCILEQAATSQWMQDVAAEINLAETAFIYPDDDAYRLKWFSPTIEVALCGHATLAAAHILWASGRLEVDTPAQFDTLSGRLTATKTGDWIHLNFPSTPAEEVSVPKGLIKAVGVTPLFIGRSRFDVLLEVETEDDVIAASPDFKALGKFEDTRGVIVTARSSSAERDFVSRFFAPSTGIDEDPATGSSHCCLSPYWALKLDKEELVGHQLSRRGGVIRTTLLGDRVQLSGQAVTVIVGKIIAPRREKKLPKYKQKVADLARRSV